MIKSIDLFAGIGGIRLGFDQAFGKNIQTVFVSEWDEAAEEYYYKPNTLQYKKLNAFISDEEQLYRFSDWGIQSSKSGISFTLKANMGTFVDRVPIIKDRYGIRRITPEECLALQSYPKDYILAKSVPKREQYKQIGNTVCVNLVREISLNINRGMAL